MNNAFKVAKWEFKRNMKNKSFLIGLFLTPILMLGFMILSSLIGDSDNQAKNKTHVFIQDNLGLFNSIQETAKVHNFNWELKPTDINEKEVQEKLASSENTAYLFIDERAIKESTIPVYTSEGMPPYFMGEVQAIGLPVKTLQLQQLGLSEAQLAAVSKDIVFKEANAATSEEAVSEGNDGKDLMKSIVPGAFAGIILLSIIFSGMYIFTSASQEKKDKVAEIILSSVTPGELMQGKILGYFMLGMVQAVVFLGFGIPIAMWKFDIPFFEYLFVPELILYVALAILGYLLYAALFVGVGATMSDMTTAGNFQGMVMMLPFLPFVFIGPVIVDPGGLFAQIGTYIPFSAPGVLLLRLTMLEEWPWLEIGIALALLLVSVWLFMKLAGKIFKVGILMYGKNATPQEIWKWIRA